MRIAHFLRIFSALILSFLLIGCSSSSNNKSDKSNTTTKTTLGDRSLTDITYTKHLKTTARTKPSRDITLSSRISEEIESIPADEGDTIIQSQTLLKFDTGLLRLQRNRARFEMQEAKQQFKISRRNYDRKKSLLDKDLVSQTEYDQTLLEFRRSRERFNVARANFQESKLRYSFTTLTSPFNGILESHMVEADEYAQPGKPLLRLIKLNPLEIQFELTPDEQQYIDAGDTIQILKSGLAGVNSGTITRVSNDTQKQSNLYEVTARIPNPDRQIPAGQTLSIRIPLRSFSPAVRIPLTYVDREKNYPRLILFDPETEKTHYKRLRAIDYTQENVVAHRTWPSNWKLLAGGIYTERKSN